MYPKISGDIFGNTGFGKSNVDDKPGDCCTPIFSIHDIDVDPDEDLVPSWRVDANLDADDNVVEAWIAHHTQGNIESSSAVDENVALQEHAAGVTHQCALRRKISSLSCRLLIYYLLLYLIFVSSFRTIILLHFVLWSCSFSRGSVLPMKPHQQISKNLFLV